jgi:GrpB-like predicted nucleotidyltransferase (UPF0157 family)
MPKLGLKTDTVKLVKYSKNWIHEFEREKTSLTRLIGKEIVAIEHVGSTAIKGIMSKPMVDLAVGVKSIKENKKAILKKLETTQYNLRKFRNPHQHLLFSKVIKNTTTHHIHVVRHGGVVWNRLLKFRDILNARPNLAREYAELKKGLAKKFPDSRRKYTLGKSKFVHKILKSYA